MSTSESQPDTPAQTRDADEVPAQIAASGQSELARLADIFKRSPSFMAILSGPQHVFDLVNEEYYRLVGHREIIGKPVREALPDVADQGFFRLLDQVYQTGEPFVGKGVRIVIQAGPEQTPEEHFVDFVFQTTRGSDGVITGVFVHGIDTTARERAEVTSQRLAAIIDSSDDAIVGKDLNSVITSWNAAAERIFGYTAAEVIGTSFKNLIPVERQTEEDDILAQITSGRRVDHLETVRLGKNGRLLDVSVTVSPIRDCSGKVTGASKIARDITERKQSEARLRASEQRFRQLWATTTDAIVIMDVAQHVEYVNPAVETVFGFSAQELFARGLSIIVPERLREAHQLGMERYLRTGVRHLDWRATEIIALHREGHEFPVEISFSHFQENGRDLFAAFIRDISGRIQAQEALQRSEKMFRQLADAMPQIVWTAQPDGVLDYTNRRWYEYIARTEAEVSPADWHVRVHPDDFPHAAEVWTQAVSSGQPYVTEFRVRGADEVYRWFLVRALPIRDPAGSIIQWYGTCTDINDQRALLEENAQLLSSERAARAEAERTGRMKDEFLATLSHELRTPLNAILGWSQVLKDGASSAEELTQGLATIERNARAQAQIIEDLLDMSRIIAGKVRLDVQRIDLAPVLDDAIETMRPAADAKGIRLQTVLDPKARPVSGDPHRLQQVFWNLLSNAIKFTPKGGRVQTVLERVNSHLEVSISDSGEGIKPEFLPHVFDRFRQADATTTREHGGLGLGLAIVKHLVELHGGSVRVKSAGPGLGSTFVVALPLTVLHAEAAPEPDERRHPRGDFMRGPVSQQSLNLEGVQVLVVDDEADARALVRRLLEDRGARVAAAGSVTEALSLLDAKTPDVLVSDIGMPGEDGYSLIRQIRTLAPARGGSLPAIALTAYARSEDRTKAILAGFQMHLAKPVEPAELLAMVASLAGRT